MASPIEKLFDTLALKKVGENHFQGNSYDVGSKYVYGGQVLMQALDAAYKTISPERYNHSMHGYFILPGDLKLPIEYEVECTRDGRSFSTRRVVAKQNGKSIFFLGASFHKEEEGVDHQIEMLNVPPPESLRSLADIAQEIGAKYGIKTKGLYSNETPIDVRPVEYIDPLNPGKKPPFRHVWFKANGPVKEDLQTQQIVATYASDFNLLITALLPHNLSYFHPGLKLASLDHAMWFHRSFSVNDWLLYAVDSPSASNSRGFCRGNIFNRKGKLVASVTQEGLIRQAK